VLFQDSLIRLTDIKDGTSNTLMVGERPPSQDLDFGWWFAGWGYNGSAVGDNVMGAREVPMISIVSQYWGVYAPNGQTCAANNPNNVGLRPGIVTNNCDVTHWWSNHTGGMNALMCDGSVHFLTYSADNILVALQTRNSGEVYQLP
jgi:prepilin-type processing-associated H-X9-DG protein